MTARLVKRIVLTSTAAVLAIAPGLFALSAGDPTEAALGENVRKIERVVVSSVLTVTDPRPPVEPLPH